MNTYTIEVFAKPYRAASSGVGRRFSRSAMFSAFAETLLVGSVPERVMQYSNALVARYLASERSFEAKRRTNHGLTFNRKVLVDRNLSGLRRKYRKLDLITIADLAPVY